MINSLFKYPFSIAHFQQEEGIIQIESINFCDITLTALAPSATHIFAHAGGAEIRYQ